MGTDEVKCRDCPFWLGKDGEIGYCTHFHIFIWGNGSCKDVEKRVRWYNVHPR